METDISKVETELEKACDWSARAQNKINRLEVLVWRLEGSRGMMQSEMDEMISNMNGLLVSQPYLLFALTSPKY